LDGAEGDYPNLPEYTKGNIWPKENVITGFRETFEEMVNFNPPFSSSVVDRYRIFCRDSN